MSTEVKISNLADAVDRAVRDKRDENRVAGAQSIHRAFIVLRHIASQGTSGTRLLDIAKATGLAMPTAHRIVRILIEEGAVVRAVNSRRLFIGPEIVLIGLSSKLRDFRALAVPHFDRLSSQIGDAIFLSVPRKLDTVCTHRKIGSYAIQVLTIDVGSRRPLGVSVNGMAILSGMPSEEAHEILLANEKRFVPYNRSVDGLMERVVEGKRLGYVYVDRALARDTRAVAVPVFDMVGRPIAGISTIAVNHRIPRSRVPRLVACLQEAASAISADYAKRSRNAD